MGSVITIFLIDKLGRRYIMLRFLPGITFSLLSISLSMWLSNFFSEESTAHILGSYMSVFFVILYLIFFSICMSGTVWSVNTEIYPIHLIGTANSIATATNWISGFLVSSIFLTMTSTKEGKVYSYLILSLFSISAWFFIYFMLPETKGNSI